MRHRGFRILLCFVPLLRVASCLERRPKRERLGYRYLHRSVFIDHHQPLRFRGGASDVPFEQNHEYVVDGSPYPEDRESFQDRLDAWKRYQQESRAGQSAEQMASPRDEQGRMKLLTSVSKGSRALIFFVLMWRDVHLYEVADQVFKGFSRLVVVIPLIVLFVGNLAGVLTTLFTSPSHGAKKRLKAILNLNKATESSLIFYNVLRLTIFPSKVTPREIYIANTLHSVFFMIQAQAFTRLSWDDVNEASPAAHASMPTGMNPYSAYYGATDTSNADNQQYEQASTYQSHGFSNDDSYREY